MATDTGRKTIQIHFCNYLLILISWFQVVCNIEEFPNRFFKNFPKE